MAYDLFKKYWLMILTYSLNLQSSTLKVESNII